jgi:hypothetical protein
MKYDLKDVARQSIYFLYRHPVYKMLKRYIDELEPEYIGQDVDYNGFCGKTFEPDDEINELLQLFDSNMELKDHCINIYRMHQAMDKKQLNLNGHIEDLLKEALILKGTVPDKNPMAMAKLTMLFEFLEKDKTEFEIAQYIGYLAINSVLGQKKFELTNYKRIRARMFGYGEDYQLPEEVINSPLFLKYQERYHMDKLRLTLELNWKLHTHSARGIRGFYVGYHRKISLDQLGDIGEERKKSNKIRKLKEHKKLIAQRHSNTNSIK